ncbi:carboxypeptidase Y-deficient [Dimargaris xerosporica]|nr:carboxypeptidase Y-deficient [Dimargaris xerosporica]
MATSPSSTPPPPARRSRAASTAPGHSRPPSSLSSSPQLFICPVCGQGQPSLVQLNTHLDSAHFAAVATAQSTESFDTGSSSSTDALSNFFRTAQRKVIDPISRLSTSLAAGNTLFPVDEWASPARLDEVAELQLRDTADHPMVTRVHWKPDSPHDICDDSRCTKPLNFLNGRQHCRRCGQIFCSEHCQLFMRLAFNAVHDPVHGAWSRVCEQCFVSRAGYNDRAHGPTRSLTTPFLEARKATTKMMLLEENKLRKRVERLAQLHANRPSSSAQFLNQVATKEAEQSIVKWQPDRDAIVCTTCQAVFSALTSRKHHCRLCGKVVCGRSGCSAKYDLPLSKPSASNSSAAVRVCRRCHEILTRRSFIVAAIRSKTHTLTAYQTLTRLHGAIEKLMPRFDDMVLKLSKEKELSEHNVDYQVAAKTRKDLLDTFAQMDRTSKQILKLKAATPTDHRLHNAIYQFCSQYLQQRMFSLSLLPRLFKGTHPPPVMPTPKPLSAMATPSEQLTKSPPSPLASPHAQLSTAILVDRQASEVVASKVSSKQTSSKGFFGFFTGKSTATPSDSEALNANAAPLADSTVADRDRLEVLREQRQLVNGYLQDAVRRRKLEDAQILRDSLAELDSEIAQLELGIGPMTAS